MNKLKLGSFERAVKGFETVVAQPTDSLSALQKEIYRDSIIQRFEYTFELAWKFIRRAIIEAEGESALNELLTRQDLFRKAAEIHLIDDPVRWFDYHQSRNLTSHVYDEEVAVRVFKDAIEFPADVRSLLEVLKKHYGA
ncbi:MAG: HI0074 family nucleotidyltransferase substrate-binding subunit [Candidatus Uhrbacteria bacterium]